MVAYLFSQAQILMLALDVQNTREGTDFRLNMMWYIVIIASLSSITIVLPFALFFAETDEEKEFVSLCLPACLPV